MSEQTAPIQSPSGVIDGRRVSVAIPNYNGRALLEVVLPSVHRQTVDFAKVIVVDDCSTDDSLAYLRENWPSVEIVAMARNMNVTVAMNECLRRTDTELLLLLNNDVELFPDCAQRLIEELERHPDAGAAAAKLVDYHDRSLLDGTGDIFFWGGRAKRRGQGKPDDGRYDTPSPIFAACGAVVLYTRTAIQDVGEFDERYIAGLEDVDWSFRARLLGYDIRYVPSAVAYHMGSATLGRTITDSMAYLNWRNWMWLILKDYPASALLIHAPQLVLQQLLVLAVALRDRRVRVWLRAWRDMLRGLPHVLRQRREVQRRRRCGTRALGRVARIR